MVKENNQTLILVTHDRMIANYADKVVTIQDGNILSVEEKIKREITGSFC